MGDELIMSRSIGRIKPTRGRQSTVSEAVSVPL